MTPDSGGPFINPEDLIGRKRPDGKLKGGRKKDPVKQAQTLWDNDQAKANNFIPRSYELVLPNNVTNMTIVKDSPTYPTKNPPRNDVSLGGAKDD